MQKFSDQGLRLLLKRAILSGDRPLVQSTISRGADVNTPDNIGLSPLMLAAMKNDVAICRILLEAGAHALYKNLDGIDALALAARNENLELEDLLLTSALVSKTKSSSDLDIPAPDHPLSNSSEIKLLALIQKAFAAYQDSLNTVLPRERSIWLLRHSKPHLLSMQDVGSRHNLTRQTIGIILSKTKRKLMHPTRSKRIRLAIEELRAESVAQGIQLEELSSKVKQFDLGLGYLFRIFSHTT